jgi:hypothetical protein
MKAQGVTFLYRLFLFTLWKRRGSEGTVPLILDFGTREESVFSRFDIFTSGVYGTVPTEGGWVGPKASTDDFERKNYACRDSNRQGIA